VLFVAQSAVWSVHGHAADSAVGLSADGIVSLGTAEGRTDSLAAEPCDVCEIARRVGSESLAIPDCADLPIASAALREPGLRPTGSPAPVERASAEPRAPPLA
jgi:hypothetical protein